MNDDEKKELIEKLEGLSDPLPPPDLEGERLSAFINGWGSCWLRVMDILASVPAARVVPGHGPAVVSWPDTLAPQRAYLTILAEDLRALIAAGQSMRLAVEQAAQSQRRHWTLFDGFSRSGIRASG